MESSPKKARTWKWWGCAVLIIGPIGFIFLVLLTIAYSLIFSDTIREDTPLTVEQARKLGCPIPLPDSARNVQFDSFHHWIEYEAYVRFEADPSVCRDHVKTVIEANDKNMKWLAHQTELVPVTSVPKINAIGGGEYGVWGGLGPVSWFDIDKITRGVVRKGGSSYDPDIWIEAFFITESRIESGAPLWRGLLNPSVITWSDPRKRT